jgi:general secretion pathway protein D
MRWSSGAPQQRAKEAVNTILSFDADWMRDQSVSIFEVRRARPEAIVDELERIFEADEGGGAIEFKPISRLRAVMALSKNATLIRRAEEWVRRLDQESASAGENVFVYRARYRDAKELARIANSLFTEGGGASAGQGPAAAGTAAAPTEAAAGGEATVVEEEGTTTIDDSGGLIAGPAVPDVIDLTQGGTDQGGVPIRISADASNNSVITYTDGETYKEVLAALRALDSTPLQVAINVIIAEVKLNNDLRYGVQYFVKSGSLDGGSGSVSLFSEAANALQKQIPGFNFLVGTNADPDLVISALDRITDVEVLSSPSLVVMENQTASLQVGDEVPITVRQSQSVEDPRSPIINQIEFRNTGIILTVTPRIGQNDAVTMQIEQEISNVNGGQNTLTPTISKRKIASSISVVSGQTVLLAGLISQNRESGRNGIPGLGRLPGVGGLFSSRTKAEGRTELVVLIRPVVVRNGEDAQSVAEEFRGRLLMLGRPGAGSPSRAGRLQELAYGDRPDLLGSGARAACSGFGYGDGVGAGNGRRILDGPSVGLADNRLDFLARPDRPHHPRWRGCRAGAAGRCPPARGGWFFGRPGVGRGHDLGYGSGLRACRRLCPRRPRGLLSLPRSGRDRLRRCQAGGRRRHSGWGERLCPGAFLHQRRGPDRCDMASAEESGR